MTNANGSKAGERVGRRRTLSEVLVEENRGE